MEGSVQTDTGSSPAVQTPAATPAPQEPAETTETKIETPETTVETTESGGEQKTVFTEKGTKLDPNPESAVHQQLANEQKLRKDYETVLRDPEKLKEFAKAAGYTLAEAKEALEEEVYSADKLQTGDDVAKALNDLQKRSNESTKKYEDRIAQLEKKISGITAASQVERVTKNLTNDVTTIREKYPELNPKDPNYDKDLENEISLLYKEIDFDEQSGSFRGNYSLARVADRVMTAAKKGIKQGSERAQTTIIEKAPAKVTSSSKVTSSEGSSIAQKIAKQFKQQ